MTFVRKANTMTKKIITPDNERTDLEIKLQKENDRLKTQVINQKEKIIDLKAKNLKLSQKVAMLQTKSKKPEPSEFMPVDLNKYK
jgi:hypothetical protein